MNNEERKFLTDYVNQTYFIKYMLKTYNKEICLDIFTKHFNFDGWKLCTEGFRAASMLAIGK